MMPAMPSAAATTTIAMAAPVRMKMMRGTRSVKVVLFVWFELTPKESMRFGAGSSAAGAKLGGTRRDARSPPVPSAPCAVCRLETEKEDEEERQNEGGDAQHDRPLFHDKSRLLPTLRVPQSGIPWETRRGGNF